MNEHSELDVARLCALLRTSTVGHTVEYRRTVDSTMPLAHELAQDTAVRAGHIVVAEEQTRGKGRRGRSWTAPYASAVLVSVILKPPLVPRNPAQIPMAAGLAVCDALVEFAPQLANVVSLKWPNDVLLGYATGAGKVAGVIAESAFQLSNLSYAILGIGINVNQTTNELALVEPHMTPPVSLRIILGRKVDRTELLALLCRHLTRRLAPDGPPNVTLEEWRSRLSTLGQRVDVYGNLEAEEPAITGTAVDVSPSGDLIVADDGGRLHTLAAADISLRTVA